MIVREATNTDYDAVWEIFLEVIQGGDTYVFDSNTPKSELKIHWFATYMRTYVAEDDDGEILGTYIIKPNHIAKGSHIANASYMVKKSAQGKGVGHLLCEHSLKTARDLGFGAIQFNIVVSTNQAAIHLWKKFGFKIIGTTPKGFQHQTLGFVDTHIMYKALD